MTCIESGDAAGAAELRPKVEELLLQLAAANTDGDASAAAAAPPEPAPTLAAPAPDPAPVPAPMLPDPATPPAQPSPVVAAAQQASVPPQEPSGGERRRRGRASGTPWTGRTRTSPSEGRARRPPSRATSASRAAPPAGGRGTCRGRVGDVSRTCRAAAPRRSTIALSQPSLGYVSATAASSSTSAERCGKGLAAQRT